MFSFADRFGRSDGFAEVGVAAGNRFVVPIGRDRERLDQESRSVRPDNHGLPQRHGGRLGDILGETLAKLGRTHQVICVTHLPQVASYAKRQWSIRKATKGKRTATTITPPAPEFVPDSANALVPEIVNVP